MARKKKRKKKYRWFWVFVRLQVLLMFLVVGAVGYYYYGGYGRQVQGMKQEADMLVRTSNESTFRASQTSVVYDINGDKISTLKGEKDVYYLNYDEIPVDVIAAIVSIEDKKFYQHSGIDYKAILRAVKAMIQNREVTQGASTITQQLARTVFLNQEKTWQRKVEEMFIAINLEKKYSKNKILEYYLNNIYFGNGYYGIQAASSGYFNADASELDLSQIAFLCAIPNNPTLYDPFNNMENTLGRRDRILNNMEADGKITKGACNLAKAEEITLNRPAQEKNNYVETYTYYCAIRLLMEQQGFVFQTEFESETEKDTYNSSYDLLYSECQKKLYTAGYRIYTSIDLTTQKQLQQAIDEQLVKFTDVNEEGIYKLQSAGVCIDNETGYVRAAVGGRSQEFNGYTLNRAYQSYRQPGSAIKPLIVYTPMLERGYTPDSIVTDQRIEDGPSNADGSYSGDMTLRSAMARSKNSVAWQLFEELTPKVGISYLHAMNFARVTDADEKLSSALGGFTTGVSPLEMASAYATVENDGDYRRPTCIMKITDADGNEVLATTQEETKVYKTTAARMATDMLGTVVAEGTGRGLGVTNMPSGGKTGTTNDNKDGWFAGFTKYYTTSVWVGYDMPEKLPGLTGSSYPGQIWHSFMEQIHEGLAPAEFLPYVKADELNQDMQEDDQEAERSQQEQQSAEKQQGEEEQQNQGDDAENAAGSTGSADDLEGN